MSGSGNKRIVINTRERAVSTDQNRQADFSAAYVADVLHFMLNGRAIFNDLGDGAPLMTTAAGPIGTPIEAAVLGGLMVVCPAGGTELAVTPGAAILLDIDGLTGSPVVTPHSNDDSIAKVVVDRSGVLAGSGTLALTANASGSTRVDVVEIRRLPEIIELSSRDIYNDSTGEFTPAVVTKVDGSQAFEYRIRLGTPGAGLPASVQGWLPICVIGVPNGAATFDPCVLYDVRPLVSDRPNGLTASSESGPVDQNDLQVDAISQAGERRLAGQFKSQNSDGYRIGGLITTNDALGADQFWLDLMRAAFRETGFVAPTNGLAYLWLMTPGGLPRWVRYSQASVAPFGGRVPIGMRGVPVLTLKGPVGQAGRRAVGSVTLPTQSGIGPTATDVGALACVVPFDNNATPAPFMVRDRRLAIAINATLSSATNLAVGLSTGAADYDTYALVYGTHIPANAKRALIQADCTMTGSAAAEYHIRPHWASSPPNDSLAAPVEVTVADGSTQLRGVVPAAGSFTMQHVAWVDLTPRIPDPLLGVPPSQHVVIFWNQDTGVLTKSSSSAKVLGWST